MTRIVFMGTPEFAVPALTLLARSGKYTLAGVVTQPGRAAGRGKQVASPPVKLAAQTLGLPVIQPERLRQPEAMAQLREWSPDLIVVAAFGQILKPEVLDLPANGCLNIHASLLPRHRGAAPIPAAILAGDEITGVTLMKMDAGLDTGPLIAQHPTSILPDDTTASLTGRLSHLGAELLLEILPEYLGRKLKQVPQDNAQATYATQIKKEDGRLDFTLPAADLARRVRAFRPWPGAFALWRGQPLKVLRARATSGESAHLHRTACDRSAGATGTVTITDNCPAVVCGGGTILQLDEVQLAGRKPLPGDVFARGARDFIGARLNTVELHHTSEE